MNPDPEWHPPGGRQQFDGRWSRLGVARGAGGQPATADDREAVALDRKRLDLTLG
jgi:hypothetical protein